MKITAKGVYGGEIMTITAEDKDGRIEFLFDGEKNNVLENLLVFYLNIQETIGNYKPDVYEDLNVYNVLENMFFPEKADMMAEGVKKVPYSREIEEKGGVY